MKYEKKRIEVEAIEFTGGNYGSVDVFMGNRPGTTPLGGPFKMQTSEGVQRAFPGDLILKKDNGDFIVMKKEDFEEVYQEVPEEVEEGEK